jgi:hypothetical protein
MDGNKLPEVKKLIQKHKDSKKFVQKKKVWSSSMNHKTSLINSVRREKESQKHPIKLKSLEIAC